jgi:transcriptional antiterminator NusG
MTAQWYIVQAHSGFEKKVAQDIREKVEQKGMQEHIAEVVVPTEEVLELRRGKKVTAERKFFPGYVLVRMELNDATWHMIRTLPKVTGFLGGSGRPSPVPQSQVDAIFRQIQDGVEKPRSTIHFEAGQTVKIVEGPFESFVGVVEGVDVEKERLRVSVTIFGRSTPVELEYTQVEKN